jgi:hypothetical protein
MRARRTERINPGFLQPQAQPGAFPRRLIEPLRETPASLTTQPHPRHLLAPAYGLLFE